MIGDEFPAGASTFQINFFFRPNSTGRPRASETPEPFGPRKRGQSPAIPVRQSRQKLEARSLATIRKLTHEWLGHFISWRCLVKLPTASRFFSDSSTNDV